MREKDTKEIKEHVVVQKKHQWIKKYWLLLIALGVILILIVEVLVVLKTRDLDSSNQTKENEIDQIENEQLKVQTKILDKNPREIDWNFSEIRSWVGYEGDVVLTSAVLVKVIDENIAEYEISYQGLIKKFMIDEMTEISDRDFEFSGDDEEVDAVLKIKEKIDLSIHSKVRLVFDIEDIDLDVIKLIAISYD